ncbi:MAG: hypothetical protein WC841_02400 [Candidatus Shapirobacteria bacterium]|jgi:hypothetical protein
MADDLTQNIDTPQDNPATPETTTSKTILPKDPKIKLLVILVSVIAILLFIALIVSATKNDRPTPKKTKATPTPTESNLPPISPTTTLGQFPVEFQAQFDDIEKEMNSLENLPPPQIDTKVGIEE